MKEKIMNALWADLNSYETSQMLLQTILKKYDVPYPLVCRGFLCGNCPFKGDEELCFAKLSNADWVDIARKLYNVH